MNNENVVKETIESNLLEKIDRFQSNSGESLTLEERQQVIYWLLEGKKIDLSGVTAIRGFIYQYYVAIYYMIEMLSEDTWWTEVVFELLDDIALVGAGKLRFVQVKTVREGGVDNHLIPSNLYSRKEEGLCWLDKLFLLNTRYLELEGSVLSNNGKIIENFDVQFEIATNALYDKKVLASYGKNDEFGSLTLHKEDDFAERLMEKFSKTIEHRGIKFILDQTLYDDVEHGVEWYLDKFYLNHLGSFSELEKQIIHKLSCVLENKYGNLQPFISAMVFQKLLSRVVDMTHRDDQLDKSSFIFKEETVKEWVTELANESHLLFYEQVKENLLKFTFERLFKEARDKVKNGEGGTLLKHEIIYVLNWIEDEFQTQVEQGNIYIYEQFLNRLFDLRYSQAPFFLDSASDQALLVKNLIQIALSLVCYSDKRLIFNESRLFFKEASEGSSIRDTFTMYNAREQESYDTAVRKVMSAVAECSYSQIVKGEYFCFITHAKRVKFSQQEHWSVLVPITSISRDGEQDEELSVTDRNLNIKFRPDLLLEEFSEEWEEDDHSNSFREPEMIVKWQNLLKKKGSEGG